MFFGFKVLFHDTLSQSIERILFRSVELLDFKSHIVIVDSQGMDTHMVVTVMDTAMDTAMDTPMTILMDTHT